MSSDEKVPEDLETIVRAADTSQQTIGGATDAAKTDDNQDDAVGLDALVGAIDLDDTEFTFRTSNGKPKTLTYRQAKLSTDLLKVAMDRNIKGDKQKDIINVPSNDETVNKLFEWMRHRNGKDMAALKKPIKFGYEGKEWDKNWGDVKTFDALSDNHPDRWAMGWIVEQAKNRRQFYKLLFAADRYSLKGLLNLGCAYLACLTKFCPREHIDRILDPDIKDGNLIEVSDTREEKVTNFTMKEWQSYFWKTGRKPRQPKKARTTGSPEQTIEGAAGGSQQQTIEGAAGGSQQQTIEGAAGGSLDGKSSERLPFNPQFA